MLLDEIVGCISGGDMAGMERLLETREALSREEQSLAIRACMLADKPEFIRMMSSRGFVDGSSVEDAELAGETSSVGCTSEMLKLGMKPDILRDKGFALKACDMAILDLRASFAALAAMSKFSGGTAALAEELLGKSLSGVELFMQVVRMHSQDS